MVLLASKLSFLVIFFLNLAFFAMSLNYKIQVGIKKLFSKNNIEYPCMFGYFLLLVNHNDHDRLHLFYN